MDSSGSDTAVPTKLSKKQLTYNAGTIKRATNRILVTGGCGFIGSHLIDRLMQDEHNEVICADNLFSGSKANIRQWLGNPRFEFVRHDVQRPTQPNPTHHQYYFSYHFHFHFHFGNSLIS